MQVLYLLLFNFLIHFMGLFTLKNQEKLVKVCFHSCYTEKNYFHLTNFYMDNLKIQSLFSLIKLHDRFTIALLFKEKVKQIIA